MHREEPTCPIRRDTLVEMLVVEREPTTRLMPSQELRILLAEVAPPPEIHIEIELGRPDAATSWPAWLVGSAIALGSAVMIAMIVT